MKPETKDRLAYALAGGAVIPALFFLLMMWLPNELATYAGLPISLPVFISNYFVFPAPASLEPAFLDSPGRPSEGFWLFLMLGNFILYFLCIYLWVWWKQRMPRFK